MNDLIEGLVNQYGCFPTNTEFGKAVDKACAKFMEELTPTLDAMPVEHLVIAGHYADRMLPQFLAGYILGRQMKGVKERRAANMALMEDRKAWLTAIVEVQSIIDARERGEIE